MYTLKLKLSHDTINRLMQCSGNAVKLYLHLSSEQIESCWPWVSDTEETLGLCESTIRRATKELYEHGFLESDKTYRGQLPKVIDLQFFYR